MFETKHLRLLQKVSELGSFAAAADALHFTPSAVSQQIAALERNADAALFERRPGGTSLTPAGEALLVHANVVLTELAAADEALEAIASGWPKRLRFGSFTSATATFAAAALERFRQLYPTVTVEFFDGEPSETAERLKARKLDLALIFDFDPAPAGRSTCDDEGLDCIDLFDDPYLLVIPRAHPLAGRDKVGLEELEGETLLGCTPWIESFAQACENSRGPCFDLSFQATGFEACQALVAAGGGVTLMPELAQGWRRSELIALPLEGAPARHVRAATPAGAPGSPPSLAMLGLVRQQLADARLSGVGGRAETQPVGAAVLA